MANSSETAHPQQLWDAFLEEARPSLSSHVFQTWLRPVVCAHFAQGAVVLEVRDLFFRDWLMEHYLDFIREGLTKQTGQAVEIEWSINPALQAYEDPADFESPAPQEPTVSESIHEGQRHPRQLNKRYIFENFVCGPSNQFAFAACKAVVEKPGLSYNPLFIFGGVGLGKTHLLSAIGHSILRDQPQSHIIYTSSERFTNEVINAVLGSKLDEFRSKYRSNCHVILVDDIQLIAGKERTQHEFFHIFNTLYDSQRQIVVTSDKLPHEIPDIEERLRNRFQWGLIADIQPPEIETRIAILRKKAEADGLDLPDEVAFFLAKSIRTNVRELEGALIRLKAHVSLSRAPLSVEYARNVLADVLSNRDTYPSVESIQNAVAIYFRIRLTDLIKSRSRLKAQVRARLVAMYLCRKYTPYSYPDLGSRFGGKDHSTVKNAWDRVNELLKSDPALRGQVLEIEREFC